MEKSFLESLVDNFTKLGIATQIATLGLLISVTLYLVNSSQEQLVSSYMNEIETDFSLKFEHIDNTLISLVETGRKLIRINDSGFVDSKSFLNFEQLLHSEFQSKNKNLIGILVQLPYQKPVTIFSPNIYLNLQDVNVLEKEFVEIAGSKNATSLVNVGNKFLFHAYKSLPVFSEFSHSQNSSYKNKNYFSVHMFYDVSMFKSVFLEAMSKPLSKDYDAKFMLLSDYGREVVSVGRQPIKISNMSREEKMIIGPNEFVKISVSVGRKNLIFEGILSVTILFLFIVAFIKLQKLVLNKKVIKWMKPFDELYSDINNLEKLNYQKSLSISGPREILLIRKSFEYLRASMLRYAEEKSNFARQSEYYRLSKQVAHDIRSPLTALNMLSQVSKDLPEDQRTMLKNATNRINDIANNLLVKKSEKNNVIQKIRKEMLSGLVEVVVSEKRLQFMEFKNVNINYSVSKSSFGLFSNVDRIEFKRVVSNLANNAVESLDGDGVVHVEIEGHSGSNIIRIIDNGKGIPAHLLEKLGHEGVTFGKVGTCSGFGLGVYGAKMAVESWGGKLKFESEEGKGTLVSIILPQEDFPKWFLDKLEIRKENQVVILDDDRSIHSVWESRFSNEIEIKHAYNPSDFKEIQSLVKDSAVYLCDYELLNFKESGLDLIEKFQIESRSILVTSRMEDSDIIRRCEELKIKILPKSFASVVPIEFMS